MIGLSAREPLINSPKSREMWATPTFLRNLEVQLIYSFVASGGMSLSGAADWAYANLAAAAVLEQGSQQAKDLMEQVEQLALLFGVRTAWGIGSQIGILSPLAQSGGWSDNSAAGEASEAMWQNRMGYTSWAKGGIANEPTWGVWGDAGPEAFLRLSDNTYVPTQGYDMGRRMGELSPLTQAEGADKPIEITLVVELDGEQLDIKIKGISSKEADNVRVKAERRNLGRRPMY